MNPLRGTQFPFILNVPLYPLENPPRRGDRLTTSAGIATVTHIDQVGKEQVFWADYGSGIAQPHVSEGILSVSSPEHPSRTRRHIPKGQACGWIEQRTGNKKREKPSVSHYYKWDGVGGRGSRYIPAAKLAKVTALIYEQRRSVDDVLQFLSEGGDRP
jgi:hypothetical protein